MVLQLRHALGRMTGFSEVGRRRCESPGRPDASSCLGDESQFNAGARVFAEAAAPARQNGLRHP